MKRWIVTFRSHAHGPADEHHVALSAASALAAIARAKRSCPPLHPWQVVCARLWPAGCADLDAALKRVAQR